MPDTVADTEPDGRRARRARNRTAVIDAMFALITEGHAPPSVDEIAERAGVSVSSVFRYFDSLDDLAHQTVERYFERFAPLFEVPGAGDGEGLDERIAAVVEARLTLYESIAPLARVARVRAVEQARIAASLAETRRFLTEQLRTRFAPELDRLGRAEAEDRLALVDSLTAFEAWDLLQGTHARSRARIRRAWLSGLRALLASS